MYSDYANNPILKTLTDEQLEAAYRVRQMQYCIEDVKAHAEDMYDHNDLTSAEYTFVCDKAPVLAELYIYKYRDCSLAENDVIVNMIGFYCQDHAHEISEMHDGIVPNLPEWARSMDEIDQDCIEQYGFLLGRPLASHEEYLQIDEQVDEMILEWENPDKFFAAYPDLQQYRTSLEHKATVYIPCEYVSSWDGFGEVSSPAKYDPVNNKVYDVELADLSDEELSECEILVGEYMDLSGKRFVLGERSDDDTWTVENPDPRYVISGMSDLCSKPALISQIESASTRAVASQPTSNAKTKEPEPDI